MPLIFLGIQQKFAEMHLVLDRTKPTPGQVLNMLGQSGAALLYQLPSPAAYTLSSANGHYRTNQEVQVNAVGLQPVAAATWSIEDIAGDDIDKLVIKFAIAGLSGLTNDLGFRWQMTCANDIIEGQASLPEPLTLGLLSVGFAGLLSRRSIKDS